MSSVSSRAVGAVVGGLVADAAGLPIHWIYNPAVLQDILAKYDKPEFIPEMQCPYYRVPTGSLSGYGDQTYVILKSLVESKGLNVDHYKASLKAQFGPGTAYDIDRTGPRPINGPWCMGNVTTFLKNYEESKEKTGDTNSKDMDAACKLGPLVALYAGDPKLMEYVETVVRVTQDNDTAVKYALAGAKLLEGYVLNGPNPNAVRELADVVDPEAKAEIQAVLDVKDEPHASVVKKFGAACSMPGNFKNSLHCLLNGTDDFAMSLRPTMIGIGDNCSRLIFAASCLGAQGGVESLPAEWLSKTHKAAEIKALAEELVKMRK